MPAMPSAIAPPISAPISAKATIIVAPMYIAIAISERFFGVRQAAISPKSSLAAPAFMRATRSSGVSAPDSALAAGAAAGAGAASPLACSTCGLLQPIVEASGTKAASAAAASANERDFIQFIEFLL